MKEMTLKEAIEEVGAYKDQLCEAVRKFYDIADSIPQFDGYEFVGIRDGVPGDYWLNGSHIEELKGNIHYPVLVYRKLEPKFQDGDFVFYNGVFGIIDGDYMASLFTGETPRYSILAKIRLVTDGDIDNYQTRGHGEHLILKSLKRLADIERKESCQK